MVVKGTQWTFRQHQQTKRCLKAQREEALEESTEEIMKNPFLALLKFTEGQTIFSKDIIYSLRTQ
jgi:hypothetical protein